MATISIKRVLSAAVCIAVAGWSIIYAPILLEPWLGQIFAEIAALWLGVESLGVSSWILFPALWHRPIYREAVVVEQISTPGSPQPLTTDN